MYAAMKLMTLFFIYTYVFAEESSFVIADPIVVDADLGEDSLRSYFSSRPEFNYFEDQSLGAASSVFLYGLDQRYLDIKLNDYSLSDASTPLGSFNLSQISGVRGLKVERGKALNLNTNKDSSVHVTGSDLGEYGVSLNLSTFKVGFNRVGGFNQTSFGEEKDWTEDGYISFDYVKEFSKLKWESNIFFNQQDQDYDNIFTHDENARVVSEFFLLGQKIAYKDLRVQASFMQVERDFFSDELSSDKVQLELFFKELLSASLYRESNNQIKDDLAEVGLNYESLDFKLLWSDMRGYFFDMEFHPIKEVDIFYNETPASLFQINYYLNKQKAFGLRYFDDFKLKNIDVRVDGFFQRAFDQVEFVAQSMSYQNFERVENIFSSVYVSYLSYGFLVQAQRAKNLLQNTSLPRRPAWVLGFDYEHLISGLELDIGLKWSSAMRAFDQSKLSSFWTSELSLKYKDFQLIVKNVLNQKKQIFRDFKRRPTTFTLQYSYAF